MSRNLDTSLAAALPNGNIMPVVFAALTFKSGVIYVWSGVGNFVFNGNTYIGVGSLGKVSPISEGSDVNAEGITVSLSGIGLSPFPPSGSVPVGVSNPVTVPSGQNVAWALPTSVAFGSQDPGASNGSAAAEADGSSALIMTSGSALGNWIWYAQWSGFTLPTLPDGAVIDAIYPVVLAVGNGLGDDHAAGGVGTSMLAVTLTGVDLGLPTGSAFAGQFSGGTIGATDAIVSGATVGVRLFATSGGFFFAELTTSFVGLAVYYSGPSIPNTSLVNEAMGDYQLGGPAQLWFGLMVEGALIGNPYLIFSGQMDQPEVSIDTASSTITIALENRLVNLSRPTARRYTSADQHLLYPDDIGCNWVEILNDIALGWGTR